MEVFTCASTERLPLLRSSIFNRTGIPAAGEYTSTAILVADAVIGIAVANPLGVPIVTPAHVSAPFGFTVFFTLLEAFNGSTASVVTLLPKSVTVYTTLFASNVTGKLI